MKWATAQASTDSYSYDQARAGFYNVDRQTTASNSAATIVYNFDNEGRLTEQERDLLRKVEKALSGT